MFVTKQAAPHLQRQQNRDVNKAFANYAGLKKKRHPDDLINEHRAFSKA